MEEVDWVSGPLLSEGLSRSVRGKEGVVIREQAITPSTI